MMFAFYFVRTLDFILLWKHVPRADRVEKRGNYCDGNRNACED